MFLRMQLIGSGFDTRNTYFTVHQDDGEIISPASAVEEYKGLNPALHVSGKYAIVYADADVAIPMLLERGINICHSPFARWSPFYGKSIPNAWPSAVKIGSDQAPGREEVESPPQPPAGFEMVEPLGTILPGYVTYVNGAWRNATGSEGRQLIWKGCYYANPVEVKPSGDLPPIPPGYFLAKAGGMVGMAPLKLITNSDGTREWMPRLSITSNTHSSLLEGVFANRDGTNPPPGFRLAVDQEQMFGNVLFFSNKPNSTGVWEGLKLGAFWKYESAVSDGFSYAMPDWSKPVLVPAGMRILSNNECATSGAIARSIHRNSSGQWFSVPFGSINMKVSGIIYAAPYDRIRTVNAKSKNVGVLP